MSKYIDAEQFKWDNERLLHCDFPYLSEETLEELIDNAPAADVVEVRHGKWTMIDKGHHFYDWECSVCGGSGRGDYTFCPNCGSKMDEVEE